MSTKPLLPRSNVASFDREEMFGGMEPRNKLALRLRTVRLGNEEKMKELRVPLRLEFGRVMLVMLPAELQRMPSHLQGDGELVEDQESREVGWYNEFFHLRRASASVCALVTVRERRRRRRERERSFML